MKPIMYIGAVLALTSPAAAQEFTGGELGFEYNQLLDDGSFDGTNYFAGVEVGITRSFSFGLNLSQLDFQDDTSTATLHGIYHMNDTTSFGAFYSAKEDDVRIIGVEGGIEIWGGDIGGFIGQLSDGTDDAIVFGLDSNTPIGNSAFSVFTDFDIAADDDIAASTNEIGVGYTINGGPEVFVQYGRADVSASGVSGSTDYIGFGAQIQFGAERGTTFDVR